MKLYLDDIRIPDNNDFTIVRSYEEAISFVKEFGIPKFISFNHDLGCKENGEILPSGHDFAKWLVDMDIQKEYFIPKDFSYQVHSANPIGRNNIQSLLNNYLLFKVRYKSK